MSDAAAQGEKKRHTKGLSGRALLKITNMPLGVLLAPENRTNGRVRMRNVHRSPCCRQGVTEIERSIAAHAWLAASKQTGDLQTVALTWSLQNFCFAKLEWVRSYQH